MAEGPSSGEVSILLGLLKENRDDTKEILKQQAAMNAILQSHVVQLGDGNRRMDTMQADIAGIKGKCKAKHEEGPTDYQPTPALAQSKQAKRERDAETETRKIRKFDPAIWIKIGLLIGAVVAGFASAKAMPGVTP